MPPIEQLGTPPIKLLGTKWPNIITAYDHSTDETYCEIHLRINFEPDNDARTDVTDAIEAARESKDKQLTVLKALLKRELARVELDNEGNVAIVNALILQERRPEEA